MARPGAINVVAAGQRNCRRPDAERFHDVARNQVQQFGRIVARKQQLAEGVEAFQFLPPFDGRARLAPGALRQLADRTAVTRKAKSAIQFCGSAMVKVPIGGRK